MPSTVIRGSDGKAMEMHPRPVDVPVERPIGESYTGKDSQLDAAVRSCSSRLARRSRRRGIRRTEGYFSISRMATANPIVASPCANNPLVPAGKPGA